MSTTQQINGSDFEAKTVQSPPLGSQTRLSNLASIAMTLEILSIAIWLGGLIAIGAIVAPVTFHEVQAVVAGNAAAKTLAGAIIGSSLRIFNYVTIVCAAILTTGMASRDPRLRGFAAYKVAGATLFLLCCSIAILAGVLSRRWIRRRWLAI